MSDVQLQNLPNLVAKVTQINDQQVYAGKAIGNLQERLASLESSVVFGEVRSSEPPPERYIRVNVTKNANGYQYETTASVTWSDGDGVSELEQLLQESDRLARQEIARRELTDVEGPAGNDVAL